MDTTFVETVTNRCTAADLIGAATTVADTVQEITETGIPYHEGEERPAQGYEIIIPPQDEQGLRNMLSQIGLPNLGAMLHFEIFKETREKTKFVYAPIKSNVISFKLWVMRKGTDSTYVSDDRLRTSFEHILAHLNTDASDEMMYHLPRILVTDMTAAGLDRRLTQVLSDLNPVELHTKMGAELQRSGLTWEQIYQEIVVPNLRSEVQKSLDTPAPQIKEPAKTKDQAVTYTRHGMIHEVIHFVAGYLSKDMEQAVYKIFIAARDPNHPLHRSYRKNMTRALMAAQKYRTKNKVSDPTKETTQLLLFMFTSEMLCDSMSIFLMEKSGLSHIYLEYGISLPEDLKVLFEVFLKELRQRDSKKMMLLFTQNDYDNSGMIWVQRGMSN